MISATQCRMARAALRWSVKELGRRARVSSNTVVRFENERHESNDATVIMIQQAFEAAGVRFVDDGVFPPKGAAETAEEQQAVEESAASLLAREEGLRASKRKGKV